MAVLVLVCFGLGLTTPAEGQIRSFEPGKSDLELLGVNTILGGLSGGVAAWIRGDPPLKGFAQGVGGGALTFAGKRLAAERRHGAGIIGRQIASVGSSIVGNAVAGRGPFDRVALGVGPLRVYVGNEVDGWADWRISVPAAAFTIWGAVAEDLEFDREESFNAGVPVFRAVDGESVDFAAPGNIFYTETDEFDLRQYILAHERVHILQYEQAFLSWSDPLEEWLANAYPDSALQNEHLEFNLVAAAGGLIGALVWDYNERPWEIEARSLPADNREKNR